MHANENMLEFPIRFALILGLERGRESNSINKKTCSFELNLFLCPN